MHKLTLDTTKINESPNVLVTFDGAIADGTASHNSIGSIDFCTRIETFMTLSLSGQNNTAATLF